MCGASPKQPIDRGGENAGGPGATVDTNASVIARARIAEAILAPSFVGEPIILGQRPTAAARQR